MAISALQPGHISAGKCTVECTIQIKLLRQVRADLTSANHLGLIHIIMSALLVQIVVSYHADVRESHPRNYFLMTLIREIRTLDSGVFTTRVVRHCCVLIYSFVYMII